MNKNRTVYGKRPAVIAALLFFLICLLSAATLSGCVQDVSAAKGRAWVSEKDVLAYYESMLAFPRSGPDYPGELDDYLIEQAALLGVEARRDEAGNVLMRAAATTGMAEARPVVLLAYTGAEDALGAATVLAVLKNAERHGDITAYFAAGDGLARSADAAMPETPEGAEPQDPGAAGGAASEAGAAARSFDFPDNASVIEVGGPGAGLIMTGAPTMRLLEASCATGMETADDGRAYVIVAEGFSSGPAHARSGENAGRPVNSIEVIAKVLSEAKSAGCAYGLRDFSGGSDACLLPERAQATVILGDYEEAQFRRIFERVARESLEKAGGADSGADIVMVEATRPASVIAPDAASKALTYLFGMMNRDAADADDSAAVNIGVVELNRSSFTCDIAVTGRAADVERALRDQSAFERLSGVTVEETGVIPGFGDGEPLQAGAGSGGSLSNEAVRDGAPREEEGDAYVLLEGAYREVMGDRVTRVAADTASPLGKDAEGATLQRIGVGVRDGETTRFPGSEAAVPVNVLLRFLEKT